MKQSLSWHKTCLANFEASLKRRAEEVLRVQQDYQRMLEQYTAYKNKIAEVEARGQDGFDIERWDRERKKRGS